MASQVERKDPITMEPNQDVEVGQAHLKELEVDVAQVLGDDKSFDLDSDHSPYPEGMR